MDVGETDVGEMPVGAVPRARMLSIVDLNQYYGESHTLWELTLEVPEGSCTCLMERGRLVAGGAIGELHEGLVRRHLTV